MKLLNVVIIVMILIFISPLHADLVHRYSFTNGDTTAVDSVGGQHGTLESGASISSDALQCDGSNDYAGLPGAGIAINTFTTGLTLEMWSTQPTDNQSYSMTVAFGDTWASNGTGRDYLMIATTRGDNVSRAAIANTPDDASPWNDEVGVNGPELNDDTEHHYVLTIDDPDEDGTGTLEYYIDGVSQGSADLSGSLISGLSNTYVYLGKGLYTGDDTVECAINEFRIYDSALTPTQIQNHYEWGPYYLTQPLVNITESDGMTVLYTGNPSQTDSYQIALLQAPTDNVVITVIPPTGLSVGEGSGQSSVLTFTPQDWAAKTVVVEIADTQVQFGETEVIEHLLQSDDPSYSGSPVDDVLVNMQEDGCGVWGYLESDYNLDCKVNLEDFAMLASLWLVTDAPLGLDVLAQDWLLNTLVYDEDIYARSIQEAADPFFVDTSNVVNTIDEKVYGHFLEHIYHSVNGGLWGDMVWNRSFENTYGGGDGVWSIEGSDLVQSSLATDVHMEFGDTAWTDYEINLEARKDGGNEAFLIVFRAPDSDNFYWLNIGGWGNTQHAIEKEVNGGRSNLVTASGSVNTGQWYDIRIRCEGNNIQVWLDGSPLFDYTDTDSPYLTGEMGVGTWETQARYRNIEVTEIPGSAVLFSGLPTLPDTQYVADFWESFGTGTFSLDSDSLNDDNSVKAIATSGSTGLQQGDFKFTTQSYHGSVWVKGTMPAGLSVQFLDGETVLGQATLAAPTSSWAEYSFSITPSAGTEDGTLRINLLGAGTVYIDQVSMMAQDSIDTGGYRPDLLEAVDDLKPTIIRWPGGCFASAYFWKDGIGPQEDRSKYAINLWDDQDTNSYGTDEYLQMCEAIGAEPLIVVNTGLLNGTCGVSIPYKMTEAEYLQDVEDWMEYCNGDAGTTTWGAVRAANGHTAPYNVKYWEIDNETWSSGYGGGITNYIDTVQTFAPVMRAKAAELGMPIELIACGSGGYDTGWNEDMIDACATLFDYISVHYYEGPENFKSGPVNYEGYIINLANYIAGSANPDMKIYNSEWNAQSTDWRTGLFAGGILNAYERQGDDFKIGGPALFLRHTSATGWDNAFINFDHTGWFAAPNYVVMKLWRDHYAPNRVETTGDDANLNVVSVLSEDEQTLYIRIVNPDATDKSVSFEIDSSFVAESAYMHYVSPGDLYARNTLADPDAVRVEAKVIGLKNQVVRFIAKGYSAGVVTVKTTQPHATKFLYSSFQGNGDGLHLASSDDGLNFTALNDNNTFITPSVGSNLMRDPSICRGPDGLFHLVWTTGWWDDGIGIAHSADLINWSSQTYLPVMGDEPDALNCWAPEIFYDDVTNKYLIFWSTTIDGAFPETYNPSDDNNHRIYYISTEDFATYTDTALFYDPGFNVIDGFIAKDGDRYVMFVKNETKVPTAEKNIRMAFSDNAAGPYGAASASMTPAGLWVEGPSAVKIGGEWHLYYDAYTSGYMGGQTSEDLESWSGVTLSFPSDTRHGTVFRVTADELAALQAL